MKPCKVDFWKKIKEGVTAKTILFLLLGAMICSFGIHNIHQRTNITEGGVIGLMLLIEHWLQISPAYITPILDIACYGLALRFLGVNFIKLSVIATLFISGFYKIWEQFPYMLPDLSDNPLAAAILGGIFVGVGVGLIGRQVFYGNEVVGAHATDGLFGGLIGGGVGLVGFLRLGCE